MTDVGVVVAYLIAIGLILLFVVGIPLWVYVDAHDNSSQSPFLWALVVFFGGLLGLALYWLIGRDGGDPSPTVDRHELPPQYR